MREILSRVSSFLSSSASDTRNSKLEESTWLMCSTCLFMFKSSFVFDFRKGLIVCKLLEIIKEKRKKKLVFCVTIFPEKTIK